MKKVAVIANGSPVDIVLQPGTQVSDMVEQLNMPSDSMVSKGDGLALHQGENIYGAVQDGEKLFVSSRADAGRDNVS